MSKSIAVATAVVGSAAIAATSVKVVGITATGWACIKVGIYLGGLGIVYYAGKNTSASTIKSVKPLAIKPAVTTVATPSLMDTYNESRAETKVIWAEAVAKETAKQAKRTTKSKSKTGLYAMRAIAVSVVFGLCALVPFSMYVSKNYNEDGIRITTPVVSMSSTNVETYSSGDAVLDAKVAELNSLLGY